jgi:hypothetical protein
MELYPTFHAAGVRLDYAGDDDQDATARLQWRELGSGTWRDGVAMSRISNSRWAGSVLWLEPDTPYEVRAIIDDPDGGATVTRATRTRRELPADASGRTWWVAVNGDDGNSGSSDSPLATLQAAGSRARPGDEIRVRPGIYYQSFNTSSSGTPAAPIHLIADGPGVNLDGSDPAYLRRTDWRDEGGSVFSVPYDEPSNRLVVAGATQRLYAHASVADLRAGANDIDQGFVIADGQALRAPRRRGVAHHAAHSRCEQERGNHHRRLVLARAWIPRALLRHQHRGRRHSAARRQRQLDRMELHSQLRPPGHLHPLRQLGQSHRAQSGE